MKKLAGQWFIEEGIMDYRAIRQVLEFQKHGDSRKFGEIALSRHLIIGKDLQRYIYSLGRIHS